jgi:hypothetical protein
MRPVPGHLNSRTQAGTVVLKHNVLRYNVLISILGVGQYPWLRRTMMGSKNNLQKGKGTRERARPL